MSSPVSAPLGVPPWCCRAIVVAHPLPTVAFAAQVGLPPIYSPTCWTPWSVFQDGSCIAVKSRACSTSSCKVQRHSLPCGHHTSPALQSTARTAHTHPAVQASLLTISRTFDSLFKVLFIFPSRYLFAIGLSSLFSLRWGIPPALSCNPKQLDSSRCASRLHHALRDCHPPWCAIPCDLCAMQPVVPLPYPLAITTVPCGTLQIWTGPASLAVTEGILVSFFSSTY